MLLPPVKKNKDVLGWMAKIDMHSGMEIFKADAGLNKN
jgi:hypothetical protein